jgi:hypothetical protein
MFSLLLLVVNNRDKYEVTAYIPDKTPTLIEYINIPKRNTILASRSLTFSLPITKTCP